jgi:hypothetical protein
MAILVVELATELTIEPMIALMTERGGPGRARKSS